jgi:hypothetical protein
MPVNRGPGGKKKGEGDDDDDEEYDPMRVWHVTNPFEVVCVLDTPPSPVVEEAEPPMLIPILDFADGEGEGELEEEDDVGDVLPPILPPIAGPSTSAGAPPPPPTNVPHQPGPNQANGGPAQLPPQQQPQMDDEDDVGDRPRPLVAVDFGHAVWIEYVEETEEKRLRFVSFPGLNEEDWREDGITRRAWVGLDGDEETSPEREQKQRPVIQQVDTHTWNGYTTGEEDSEDEDEADQYIVEQAMRPVDDLIEGVFVSSSTAYGRFKKQVPDHDVGCEGVVRTLTVPDELDLGSVETINIDQSQGAILLSVKEGKIFILYYH